MQLVQLQQDVKRLQDAGILVVGVSYDPVGSLKKFSDKAKISYPLLADTKSEMIGKFGVLNNSAKGHAKGVPYPGTIVINQEGNVGAKLFLNGYVDRHSTEALIKAVKGMMSE